MDTAPTQNPEPAEEYVPLPESVRSKAWAAAKPVALAEWQKGSADTMQMLIACGRALDAALVEVLDEDALLDNEGMTRENDALRARFVRRWVCGVARSGFHNGATCSHLDPHSGWGCGWYWEASIKDENAARFGLAPTHSRHEGGSG